MKTIEVQLFAFPELSEEGKAQVIERESHRVYSDPDNFDLEECMDSFRAILKAIGATLSDYSIGCYNRGNFASTDEECTVEEFRAMLIEHGYSQTDDGDIEFPGTCGFTGVCFDEDIAEAMLESLEDGDSLTQATDRAADIIMRIAEQDLEYRASEEGIMEGLDTEAEIYTKDGSEA